MMVVIYDFKWFYVFSIPIQSLISHEDSEINFREVKRTAIRIKFPKLNPKPSPSPRLCRRTGNLFNIAQLVGESVKER